LVPLVSGTGLLALVLGLPVPRSSLLIILSVFAAAITWALWRWELRNIQRCRWLLFNQAALAEKVFTEGGMADAIISRQPPSPQGIGKRNGEDVVYGLTILVWLAVPLFLADWTLVPRALQVAYALAVAVLLSLGLWSLRAEVEVKRATS
jgi:hypothetical protein